MISTRAIGLGLAALLAASGHAFAQSYPSQTVRIVVPFSAGSITDGLARMLADKLSTMWKQQVIVENRPGLPGTATVATSKPDGHTLMLTSNGHTIARAINKTVPFDPVKDFAGITVVASAPLAIIVPPDSPAKTLKELLAQAAQNPGKLNFGSAGVASTTFLATEVMRQEAKLDMVHVPFKGVPEAVTAVLRGDVQMYFSPIPSAVSLGSVGKLRVLAVNTAKRVSQLPDVPTVAEAALPNYRYEAWFGVMAPAGTPAAIRDKVAQDIAAVLKMPEVIDQMQKVGNIPMPTTPAEFDKIISDDTARYGKVMADAGIAPQ
ncbi:MAG: tripartite tricarboxylate transporter substrate binding protein [Xanthobacteraceae bacterium]|nr:tripartite tricarboxylate transporter substrate binding protein [Xanthobacteraceae bacterium]